MSELKTEIKAGLLPYSDGSGCQVSINIVAADETTLQMSINTIHLFDVSKWPEVRTGIDKLLLAVEP